jgi:uracil-DNA glycosylase family 4
VNPDRLLRQQLQSLSAAGLSHLPRVELPAREVPVEPAGTSSSTSTKATMARSKVASSKIETLVQPPAHPREPILFESAPVPGSPKTLAGRQAELELLAEKVQRCTRCSELASTRTQTVFGVGNPEARIVFIGEAPGADEDKQGEPFVGRAGQLLNQIITASRLKREEIYICNVLKCRPPGNRLPLETECANCREYLLGQLAAIDPEYIVCWGTVASQNLLKSTTSIGKLRGRFLQFGRAKVLCTYHPSYLLRNPAAKKDVWQDMQFLMADMGIDLTAKS